MKGWQVMVGAPLLCAVGGLVGCASPAPPRAPVLEWTSTGNPVTVIEFEDHTDWPFELDAVVIVLDGEMQYRRTLPPGHGERLLTEVGRFSALPAGDHTLSVMVRSRFAATQMDASDGCHVTMRTSRTFRVGQQPVGIRVSLKTEGVHKRFADRLDLHIDVAGRDVLADTGGREAREVSDHNPACREDAPLPFSPDEVRAWNFGPATYIP